MNGSQMSLQELVTCLKDVGAVELTGMRLLKAHSSTGCFPAQLPRAEVKAAVVELVAYTGRCQKVAQRLSALSPVPLSTLSQLEFAL